MLKQKSEEKRFLQRTLAFLCSFVFLISWNVPSVFSQEKQESSLSSPIGCWTFDDAENGSGLSFANSAKADIPATASKKLNTVAGLFGNALELPGNASLSVAPNVVPEELAQLTFSAWVQPMKFGDYNEIIRKEDGASRLLFSFQSGGSLLSLGLNVGGIYQECDAPISAGEVLDEDWHLCAATFDGQTMRVYLDGLEIGNLDNPGELIAKGGAPMMIGSSSGNSEFFNGLIDEVRFYDRALSADEIKTMYKEGEELILAQNQTAFELFKQCYEKQDNFVNTICSFRSSLKKLSQETDNADVSSAITKILSRQLRQDFPEDYTYFLEKFEIGLQTLFSGSADSLKKEAVRMLGLYTEYKPLSELQWMYLSKEETAKWHRVEEVEKEVNALLNAENSDPVQWFGLIFEMSHSIQERPYLQEAVAPYREPMTPPVVDLTEEQAQYKIEKEWLFQCENQPSKKRILDEIEWALAVADRLEFDDEFASERAQLTELHQKAEQLDENAVGKPAISETAIVSDEVTKLYFAVRTVKRALMFKNPVLDFDTLLYVDMPNPDGNEWWHETRHRLGYMGVPGGRLMKLQGLSPAGKQTMLMPQEPFHGSFWRPDVSYDGKRVLFCFKPHNEKTFHIYEMNVDGTNLRQLTGGVFDDLDPIYLPDGEHIVFSTTRGYSYVRCMPPTNAYVLARMTLDSKDLYLISRNNEPDYLPSVLEDGRIVFSRWEYTDKPLWRCVSLWTMNPDGTQTQVLWGNQSVWPDLPKDVRQIPNSDRLMFTGSAHHNWFAGSIGIVNPSEGLNFPDGLTKVTAELIWPESGNGPVDPIESPDYHASGKYTAYSCPYPLSEKDFMVSALRNGKSVLLLMDTDGNRELIYEGVNHIYHAMPIRPREVPNVLADRVKWPSWEEREHPADGLIYSNNVYENAPEELKGKAKYLRIMNIEPKTYTLWDSRPYISTGPAVSMVQSEGVKRILGTVPVREDGSVAFKAPSGVALHFQLLDENMKCLQTMRSFTGVMPGEQRGCLGCHESHIKTPAPQGGMTTSIEPSTIMPPPWKDISVSYERYVQPVLDKHCGECHSGDGDAKKVFDTTLRPGFLHFKEPYITIIGNPTWGDPHKNYPPLARQTWGNSTEPEYKDDELPPGFGIADTIFVEGYSRIDPEGYATPKPMEKLSYASRLVNKYCSKEHYNVQLSQEELLRIIVWVDAMCPYMGSEEVRALPDPKFQGSDWIALPPRLETAPVVPRPGPFHPFEYDGDDAYKAPSDEKAYANPVSMPETK